MAGSAVGCGHEAFSQGMNAENMSGLDISRAMFAAESCMLVTFGRGLQRGKVL